MQPLDEETHPANMSVQRNTSIQERGARSASSSSAGSWRPSVFDFRSGGTCPTCHGTGRIPKGTRGGGQGGESLELLRVVSRSQTLGKQERVWSTRPVLDTPRNSGGVKWLTDRNVNNAACQPLDSQNFWLYGQLTRLSPACRESGYKSLCSVCSSGMAGREV